MKLIYIIVVLLIQNLNHINKFILNIYNWNESYLLMVFGIVDQVFVWVRKHQYVAYYGLPPWGRSAIPCFQVFPTQSKDD